MKLKKFQVVKFKATGETMTCMGERGVTYRMMKDKNVTYLEQNWMDYMFAGGKVEIVK
jgi:hypothetical protein